MLQQRVLDKIKQLSEVRFAAYSNSVPLLTSLIPQRSCGINPRRLPSWF
jgi:hypothetical protein